MRLYIAGPMTGIPGFNIPAFEAAAHMLRARGHRVFSPVELDGDDVAVLRASETGDHADLPRPYEDYIQRDEELLRTEELDAIALLPGWENSGGVARELAIADERGLELYLVNGYEPKGLQPIEPPKLGDGYPTAAPLYDGDRFVPFSENPERQRSATGGVKDNRSKPRVDLIPIEPLIGAAEVLAYGAEKYKPHNWRLGLSWSQTYASLQRHLMAWFNGEDTDPETGHTPLDHAMCQLLFLTTYVHRGEDYKQHDDRWQSIDPDEAKA